MMQTEPTAFNQFAGMFNILRFNWQRYTVTLIGCLFAGLAAMHWAGWLRVAMMLAVAIALFWTVSSLVVSHWVYDRSEIHRWTWVTRWFPIYPHKWVQLHAGLDESSASFRVLFPNSRGTVLDIFDAKEMTEASILEARTKIGAKVSAADFRHLPLADGNCDAVFLIFAAHELRRAGARNDLFRELFRITGPKGRVLVLEHLRDWRNFIAFGPGFLHFHSRREWLRLAATVGLTLEVETSMTPFVRLFIFRKET